MTTAVNTSLDRPLIESVDAALSALGSSTRDSILLFLRKKYSISMEDIPQRIDEFLQALNELLGYGARVIEKLVIARLVETAEIPLAEARGRSLAEIVVLSRKGHSKPRAID
jgi:DNA-binding transcriptional ArsR family regulator